MRLAIVGVLLVMTESPASAFKFLGIRNGMRPLKSSRWRQRAKCCGRAEFLIRRRS